MEMIFVFLSGMILCEFFIAICREGDTTAYGNNGSIAQDIDSMREKLGRMECLLTEVLAAVVENGKQDVIPKPDEDDAQRSVPNEQIRSDKTVPDAAKRTNDAKRIIPHRDYMATNGDRSHYIEEIEYACEIVGKDRKSVSSKDEIIAGYIFTDLADTCFFEQLMLQNEDLKDSIERSMRKFMARNREQEPCDRYYVPEGIYQKYMTTNEY